MSNNNLMLSPQFEDIAAYPPWSGIRFRPTDEELVTDYLASAAATKDDNSPGSNSSNVVIEYDVYSCPPWDLPRHLFEYSHVQTDMYFLSKRRPKTEGGTRVDRSTAGEEGFWCYNSKRTPIENCHGELIGSKCSLNYTKIISSDIIINDEEKEKKKKRKREKEKEEKTSWIMHEYTLQDHRSTVFQNVVLCHIYDTAQDKQPKRATIIVDEDEEEAFTCDQEQHDDQLLLQHSDDHTSSVVPNDDDSFLDNLRKMIDMESTTPLLIDWTEY